MIAHVADDVYYVGGAAHDSYLVRLQVVQEESGKRRKLEEGVQASEGNLTVAMRIEDQVYCLAPVRDVVLDANDKNSFLVASGQGKLGFISTLYVLLSSGAW